MATGFASEVEAFRDFLSDQLSAGRTDLSAERCVEEFRAYQCELEQFQRETRAAIEESRRGESGPLDADALKRRIRKRLAERGITE